MAMMVEEMVEVGATNRHKSVTGGAATVARLFAYWQLLTHESVATSAIGKCTMAKCVVAVVAVVVLVAVFFCKNCRKNQK